MGMITEGLYFFLALLILSGCNRMDVHHYGLYDTVPFTIKSYEVGKSQTAYIGQSIVRWQPSWRNTKIDSVELEEDFMLSGSFKRGWATRNVNIQGKRKNILPIAGIYKEYFVADISDANGITYGILFNDLGHIQRDIIINDNHDRYYTSDNSKLVPDVVNMTKKYLSENKEDTKAMTKELIFGGINNVTLNITYREYTGDDLARPAFFQNLVYQTNADTIRFQDFKIKIQEATNEKIVYTILEDGLK